VAWFTNSQQQLQDAGLEKSAQDEFVAAIMNWKLASNSRLPGNMDTEPTLVTSSIVKNVCRFVCTWLFIQGIVHHLKWMPGVCCSV
jgi:hypothetical protein